MSENNQEEFVWDEAEALRRIERIKEDHLRRIKEHMDGLIEYEKRLDKRRRVMDWAVTFMTIIIWFGSWFATLSDDKTSALVTLMYWLTGSICFFGGICWRQLVIISLNKDRRETKETVFKFFITREVHEVPS